jgi:hypothetical protein
LVWCWIDMPNCPPPCHIDSKFKHITCACGTIRRQRMLMSKGCTTNVVFLGMNKISMLDRQMVSKPSSFSWSLPKRMCHNTLSMMSRMCHFVWCIWLLNVST